MDNCFAVMDLGTNTFHLLIVEGKGSVFTELVHEQEAVKLGEGGINKGFIQQIPYERGIDCMLRFQQLLLKYDVHQVRAIATSALRNATNGSNFIYDVKAKTGIAIEIIDGDAEAGYIFGGIRASGSLGIQNSLIVDIGGGSVEFIICNDEKIYWKQSFEIGAARLMDKFHRSDPIPAESINALNIYLEDCLKDLLAAVADYPINDMIGSSSVFESYAELMEREKGNSFDLKKTKHFEFDKSGLLTLIERIVQSSHQERLTTKGILPVRIDMIVTASLLARFIIEKLGVDRVVMSTSSLKEGVLAEMMG